MGIRRSCGAHKSQDRHHCRSDQPIDSVGDGGFGVNTQGMDERLGCFFLVGTWNTSYLLASMRGFRAIEKCCHGQDTATGWLS